MLLTQRTAHLEHHAGQISFPGGRAEEHDRSQWRPHCARRRKKSACTAGLSGDRRFLDLYQTVTGFLVTPVVVSSNPVRLDAGCVQVAEAFEVPLAFVLDPRHPVSLACKVSSGATT